MTRQGIRGLSGIFKKSKSNLKCFENSPISAWNARALMFKAYTYLSPTNTPERSMCYSAMVQQDYNKLGFRFKARIDYEEYLKLFTRRLDGEKLIINKAMEFPFVDAPKSTDEKKIKKVIEEWHKQEISRLEAEAFKQKERLANAERALKTKVTKKAQEDQRISTNKIEKAKVDLKKHGSYELKSDSDSRIFPFHYLSMLSLDEDGKKVISPFRYLMRPHDKDESFDREYGGCYNARFDNLKRVGFWKDSLAKRRGLILVRSPL